MPNIIILTFDTLLLLDLVRMPHHADQVRKLILQNNFFVVRSQIVTLSRKKVEQFYNEHAGKFFYNR